MCIRDRHYDTLKAAQDAHAPILAYVLFINTIVNFLIIAFAIFVLIKQINRLTPPPAPAPEPRRRKPVDLFDQYKNSKDVYKRQV